MGTIKFGIGVALIGAVILIGIFVIPPYFSNYQFEDEIKTQALTLTYTTKNEDEIRQIIYKRATALDIPITPDQIEVHSTGTQGNGSLLIDASYTVRVNLPGYPFDLALHAGTKNQGIY